MDDKKLTKKVLAEVANDLSKAMDFEKPIETGDKVTKKEIIADLKEAGKELLPKDKISDLSREVLTFLKVELPKPKEPVSDKTGEITGKTEKTKKETKAVEKDKKVEPKLPKKSEKAKDEFGFSIKSKNSFFAAAIKETPMTMAEIKKEKWNNKNGTHYSTWKALLEMGAGQKTKDGKMSIKKNWKK